ncbi:MAG TPA: cystathionine gamma-synthase [Treponema sp.]|nr:cystathionine gamma-synthase [Treponema sp.]
MNYSIRTTCVAGNPEYKPRDNTGCISIPVYQSATFAHPSLGESTGYDYSRLENPTREYAEQAVAALDHVKYGFAFSSGMAAVTSVFDTFENGSSIISSDDLYGGSIRLFDSIEKRNGITLKYTDTSDIGNVEKALDDESRSGHHAAAVYIETPSNPTMLITDIRKTAELAHRHNAILIVDNTFLTPYFQQPFALGADIVIQSGTKFLCGHNDTLAGFITTDDDKLAEKIAFVSKTTGANLSPFDSFLAVRGIKTLAVRMEAQQKNAQEIVSWLSIHPDIKKVLYPGLTNHPGYEVNKSQATGSGSMMSFYVDTVERAERVLGRVKLIRFAESLGGVDSLITYPMTQTHADVPEEDRLRKGIDGKLLRLSVGIEDSHDLIADLAQALN